MDVKALQWKLAAFVAERGLESRHSPKSLAMALAAEGGALLDLFKWLSDEESRQVGRQEREAAAEAIAEIFLHALRLADELGTDLEDAVAAKIAKLTGRASGERAAEPPRAAPPPPPSHERETRPPVNRPAAPPAPPAAAYRATPPPVEFPRVRQAASPPARPPASPPPRPAAPAPTRPAPRAAAPAPPPPPPPPPEVDRYAELDLDAVTELVKALTKRIDDAQSDDPLARELYDELATLKRTLYGKTLKRSWIGTSLENVRAKLRDATHEAIGEPLRARDYIAQIDRLLKD